MRSPAGARLPLPRRGRAAWSAGSRPFTLAAAQGLKKVADQIYAQYWNPLSPSQAKSPYPPGYPAGGYGGGIAINTQVAWVPPVPWTQAAYNLNADFETTGTPDGAATPAGLAVTPGGSGTAYYYSVSQVSNFTESIPAPAVGPAASTGAALSWSQGEAVLSTYKVRRSLDAVNWATWCSAQFTATGSTGNTFTVAGAGWTVNQWAGYWCTILNNTRFATLAIQITSNTATVLTLSTTWQPSSGTTTVPPSNSVFCISAQLSTGSFTDTGAYTWTTLPDYPSSYRHDPTTDITNLRVLLQARTRLDTTAYDTLIAELRPVVYQEWWEDTFYKSWMYFDLLELDRLDPGTGWGAAAAYMCASVYLNAYHAQPGSIVNNGSYNSGAPAAGDPSFYRSYTLPEFGWNWQGTYNPAQVYAYPEAAQAADGTNWWAITSVPAATGPPVDELQTITLNNATGGSYTLTFGGQTTASISYNSTPSTIQSRLNALSSIGANGVTVTTPSGVRQTSGVPATVDFSGASFASAPQALITVAANSLTGTSPTITITEVSAGNNNTGYWRAMPNYRVDYAWEDAAMFADAAARFDGTLVTGIQQAGFTQWILHAADLNAAADVLASYLAAGSLHPATGLPCTQVDYCYPGVPGSGFVDQASNNAINGGQAGQVLYAMCVIQRHRPSSALLAAIRKMINVTLGVQKFSFRGAFATSTSYNAYDIVSQGTYPFTTIPVYYMAPAAFTSGGSFNAANWVTWTGTVYAGTWTSGMTVVQYQTIVSLSGVTYMRIGASGTSSDSPPGANWYAITWYPVASAGALLFWDPANGGVWGSIAWDGSFDHNGSIPAGTSSGFYYSAYKETGRQIHILRGLIQLCYADPAGTDAAGTPWTTWRDQWLTYTLGDFWFVPPGQAKGGYVYRLAGDYSVFADPNTPKLGFGAGAVPPNSNSYTWNGRYNPATTYAAGSGVCALLPSGAFGAYAAGGTGGNPAAGQDPVNFPTLWTPVPAPVYLGETWSTSEAMGIGGSALAEYMEATGT